VSSFFAVSFNTGKVIKKQNRKGQKCPQGCTRAKKPVHDPFKLWLNFTKVHNDAI